jgi:hypothetical protein
MAAVGTFIHSSQHTLALAITDAFVAGNRHALPLNAGSTNVVGNSRGVAHLSAIYIHVNTIAAGATGLTFSLSVDTAGNQKWIGDTTATFSTGITTATQGSITAKLDVDFIKTADDVLYLHAKTTTVAGTCTIDRIELVWRE